MNRCTSLLFTLIAASMLIAPPSPAETHRVGPPGEADYPTIQEAMSACADGDTVLILPGTYTGPDNRGLDPGLVNMTIAPRDSRGSVTIDCENLDRCFHIHGGQDTTMLIQNITILRGGCWWWPIDADYGGGVLVEVVTSVKISGCAFLDCSADEAGAGVHVDSGSITVTDTSFEGGYGESSGGCVSVHDGSCVLRRCTLTDNCGHAGGAFVCRNADARFFDCEFRNNEAYTGGGMYAEDSSVTLERCLFVRNHSTRHGAAIHNQGTTMDCSSCVFADNYSFGTAGAQITLDAHETEPVTFSRCTITGNQTWQQNPAGLIRLSQTEPLIEYCVLAFSPNGPVATVTDQSMPEFTRCVVHGIAGGDSLLGHYHDNLFVDPLFCDVYTANLDHCSNSPCLPENNHWGVPVGTGIQGCGSCDTPVTPMTWGTIKAMYR